MRMRTFAVPHMSFPTVPAGFLVPTSHPAFPRLMRIPQLFQGACVEGMRMSTAWFPPPAEQSLCFRWLRPAAARPFRRKPAWLCMATKSHNCRNYFAGSRAEQQASAARSSHQSRVRTCSVANSGGFLRKAVKPRHLEQHPNTLATCAWQLANSCLSLATTHISKLFRQTRTHKIATETLYVVCGLY
jgi:hypothetical protein